MALNRTALIGLVILLAALLAWVTLGWNPPKKSHLALEVEQHKPTGGDFTLKSADGPVSLHDFRGKVVLLYFGYTWCPDICPTSLALMSQGLSGLDKKELADVQGIFVSVDPARDTVQRLKTYTAYFHPKIMGVTGTPDEVADVAKLYNVSYRLVKESDSATGYTVDHSSFTYVIGKKGKLREVLPHGTQPERIRKVIRKLLAE